MIIMSLKPIIPLAAIFLLLASCSKEPEAPQTDNGGMSQYNEHEWYWDDSTKLLSNAYETL